MRRNSSSRSAPTRKDSPLLAGILVGMVIGLAIAGGVAWYILKTPGPFMSSTSQEQGRLVPEPAKPAPAPAAKNAPPAPSAEAASGVAEGKPRFEFYKVLTDKQDSMMPAAPKESGKPAQKPQAAAKEVYYLQAGSFSNADDADKMKAKLSMLGMEVNVQTATIPDKGVWHRVRLGPYKGAEEMNKALAMLKQNGVSATPMLAQ